MKKTLLLIVFLSCLILLNGQPSNVIDSLLKVVKFQKDSIRSSTILRIGQLYNRKGMIDSADYYFKLLLKYAENQDNKTQICLAHLSLGSTNIHKDNFDEALDEFFKAIKIAEKENWGDYIADADIGIGYIYMVQKREKDALQFYLNAEKKLLEEKVKDTMYLVTVYTHLADCLGTIGDTARAIQYFKTGSGLCDKYEIANSKNESKKEYLNLRRLSLIYNISDFLTNKDDIGLQLKKLMLMLADTKDGANNFQKFKILNIIAAFHLQLDNYKEALGYAELALKTFTGPEYDNNFKDIHETIAKAAAALKQYDKAYSSLSIVNKYNDSVYNDIKLEEINSVEARYKTEKKDQEIITLNKEKKAQKIIVGLTIGSLIIVLGLLGFVFRSKKLQKKLFAREKEIQKKELEQKMAELEQTALRAQMNPHFIFNCLNSVQRYVINHDAEGVNHYLSTFANLIRQTLENSGKPLIPLNDEIRYLETYIKMEQLRSNNRFDYYINISPDVDQSGTYIPNMIVQPFVENSIHHGMSDTKDNKGIITLDFSQNNKLTCTINDNGPGIKNNSLLRNNEEEAHTSMGGVITKKRIAMYNSFHEDKIEIEVLDKSESANAESGTRVILKFPLSN